MDATTDAERFRTTTLQRLATAAVHCARIRDKSAARWVSLHARLACLLHEFEGRQKPDQAKTLVRRRAYEALVQDFDAFVAQYGGMLRVSRLVKKKRIAEELKRLESGVETAARELREMDLHEVPRAMGSEQPLPARKERRQQTKPHQRELQQFPTSILITSLVSRSAEGTDGEKDEAVRQLRHLAFSDANKKTIVESGGVRVLVDLLQRGNDDQKANSAATLRNLALASATIKTKITKAGGAETLIQLVRSGTDEQQLHASAALWSLAFDDATRRAIIASGGVEAFVELVRRGTDEQADNALRALRELVNVDDCQPKLCDAGAVQVLVACVETGTRTQTDLAARILLVLVSGTRKEVVDIVMNAGGLKPLLSLIQVATSAQKECVIGILCSILASSLDHKFAFAGEGGIALIIALLRDDTSAKVNEYVLRALGELVLHPEFIRMIKDAGGVEILLGFQDSGTDTQGLRAKHILEHLHNKDVMVASADNVGPESDFAADHCLQNSVKISTPLIEMSKDQPEMSSVVTVDIPQLIVKLGTNHEKASAIDALKSCMWGNTASVTACVRLDGVPALVSLVRGGTDLQKGLSAFVLWCISKIESLRSTVVAAGCVGALNEYVREGSNDMKLYALWVLRELVVDDEAFVTSVVEFGWIGTLLRLVCGGSDDERSHAIECLWHISVRKSAFNAAIVNNGAFEKVIYHLLICEADQREYATSLLFNFASDATAGASVIDVLVRLFREGTTIQQERACFALQRITTHETRPRVIRLEDCVGSFVRILTDRNTPGIKACAGNLISTATFSVTDNTTRDEVAGLIAALVRLGRAGTVGERAPMLSALHKIGCKSTIVTPEKCDEGIIEALLFLVSDGTSDQKNDALFVMSSLVKSAAVQEMIVNAGGVGILVEALKRGAGDQIANNLVILHKLANHEKFRSHIGGSGSIKPIVELLGSSNGKHSHYAAEVIRSLAYECPENRSHVHEAGGIVSLVDLIQRGTDEERSAAAGALLNLASCHESAIVDAGGVSALTNLARVGTNEHKERALGVLLGISAIVAYRPLIVHADGVPVLVSCMRLGTDLEKEYSLRILCRLTCEGVFRSALGDADAIIPTVELMKSDNASHKHYAVQLLLNLAHWCRQSRAQIVEAGGMVSLLELVRNGTEGQKTVAVGALTNIVQGNESALIDAGGVPTLISLAQVGTDRQKTDAVETMLSISQAAATRQALVDAGSFDLFVQFLTADSDIGKGSSLKILCNLTCADSNRPIVGEVNAIAPAVELVQRGADIFKVYAAELLLHLAYESPTNQASIIDTGGPEVLADLIEYVRDAQCAAAAVELASLVPGCEVVIEEGTMPPVVYVTRVSADGQKEVAVATFSDVSVVESLGRSVVEGGAADVLLRALRSGTDAEKERSLQTLCESTWSDSSHDVFWEADVIEAAINLLYRGTKTHKTYAVELLSKLADQSSANRAQIVDSGGVTALIQLLADGSVEQQLVSIGALRSIISGHEAAFVDGDGIGFLFYLAQDHSTNLKECAVEALTDLASVPVCRQRLENSGGVALFANKLQSGTDTMKLSSLRGLCSLMDEPSFQALALDLEPVVRLLDTATDAIKERAAQLLRILSEGNGVTRGTVLAANPFRSLIKVVREGNSQLRKEAGQALMALTSDFDTPPQDIDIIEVLVTLVRYGLNDIKERAALSLGRLGLLEANKMSIVSAGGVNALVELLKYGTDRQKTDAIVALTMLARNSDGVAIEAIHKAGSVPLLQESIDTGSWIQKASAANALNVMALPAGHASAAELG